MRRMFFSLMPVLFLLLFGGCSQIKQQSLKAEDIDFSFQCKADVTCNGQMTTCILSRPAPGIASIQLSSGDLSGLTYFWSGEDFTISYIGLTAKSEECVLPKIAFASVLQQTVDYAEQSGVLTKTHGNEFSGSAPGYDFTVSVNEDSGQIQKIDVPKYGITANLYDYSELGV